MTAKPKATTQVATIDQAISTSVLNSPDPLLAMIERASRDPSIDLDRMERLIQMRNRDQDRAAEQAFNDAMNAVQDQLTPIARDSNNPQTHSRYASYFAVDKVIRPVYVKHGFSLTFDTEDGAPEGHIRVAAYLSKGPHSRKYRYDSPAVTAGFKGTQMMTETHARASALTYAKRYLVGLIFNLSTGEDRDGNQITDTSSGVATAKQIKEIRDQLLKTSADEGQLCKHLKIESLDAMTELDYDRAKKAIEARKQKLAAQKLADALAKKKAAAAAKEGEEML